MFEHLNDFGPIWVIPINRTDSILIFLRRIESIKTYAELLTTSHANSNFCNNYRRDERLSEQDKNEACQENV